MKAIIHAEHDIKNEEDFRVLAVKTILCLSSQGRNNELNPHICINHLMDIVFGMVWIDANCIKKEGLKEKELESFTTADIYKVVIQKQMAETLAKKKEV